MFIADVVNVKADDKYLNAETGKLNYPKLTRWYMCMADIMNFGTKIGKFGWTVEKNRSQKGKILSWICCVNSFY